MFHTLLFLTGFRYRKSLRCCQHHSDKTNGKIRYFSFHNGQSFYHNDD